MPEQKKPTKKSVLIEKEKEEDKIPPYSDDELAYIGELQKRLENARTQREQSHEEFDGMSLNEYWRQNERWANTMIKAKTNKSDVTFQSGTLRTKMIAFLSTLIGLNLSPDITACDKRDIKVNSLGDAMEDVISKTEELEQDEEKKMLRQYELLKQGTIFVEDIWDERYTIQKDIQKGFIGLIAKVKWAVKKVKQTGKCVRNIIPLPSVYLGSLSQYFIEDQPYIFTVETKSYAEAEQIYGNWERWGYVSKSLKQFSGSSGDKMVNNMWRLEETKDNQVEIIKYQDKPNNEYQIILNGVLMLPIGYPFPWKHGEYSITQQNLEPIRQNFAYGKSFIFKNKNTVSLLDEMIKLAVLKTQKSFMPPYINTSGRVISSRVLMPGKISMSILPGTLIPITDKETQGVTVSEFNMIQELIKSVDRNTASQTFTGAKEAGGTPTATQIIELQRQAKIMMGIIILSASLLEKKLGTLRLMNILENWFNPFDTVVDKARDLLKNKYRIVSKAKSIEGKGMGVEIVIPTEHLPTTEDIIAAQETITDKIGAPVRIITLNPKVLKQARYTWVVNVFPKEKKSSELSKMMFRGMVDDAIALGLRLNLDYIEERFAEVWQESPSKMFERGIEMPPEEAGAMPAGAAPRPERPQVRMGRPTAAAV